MNYSKAFYETPRPDLLAVMFQAVDRLVELDLGVSMSRCSYRGWRSWPRGGRSCLDFETQHVPLPSSLAGHVTPTTLTSGPVRRVSHPWFFSPSSTLPTTPAADDARARGDPCRVHPR